MPTGQRDRVQLWTRVGLAAFVEGAKAVPGVGSLLAAAVAGAGEYLKETTSASELPEQARGAVRQLAQDYRELIESELRSRPGDNSLELALVATLDILSAKGLSANELAGKADLDADLAARLTLQQEQVKKTLESLYDTQAQELTEKLVGEYYYILLRNKNALSYLGLDALRTILARQSDFETKLERQLVSILVNQGKLLNFERVKAWRKASWPVRPYPVGWTLHPYILKPEYCLIPYKGKKQTQMRDETVAWAQKLGRGVTPLLGMRLYIGPGGAGKTRLLIEVGKILHNLGWAVYFLGKDATPEDVPYFLEVTGPTLLILDYVTERETLVQGLLLEMARRRDSCIAPCALILLDRTTPPWFKELDNTIDDQTYVGLPELLELPTIEKQPQDIPSIDEEEERQQLFNAAIDEFAQRVQNHAAIGITSPPDLPVRPLFVLLLALLAVTGEDVAHLDDENKILAATWNRERQMWREKLEHANLSRPLLGDAVDFIQDMHVLRTLGLMVDRRSGLSAYLRMYFDEDDLQGNAALIIERALCPKPFCALDAIAPDPLADWVTYRFCIDHELVLDLLKNVFPPAKSVARAALVFHRLLAKFTDLHIEEELIVTELCKWADRRLTPDEVPSLFAALAAWMPSADMPTDKQNSLIRSMDVFMSSVSESVSEIQTIDLNTLSISGPTGAQG